MADAIRACILAAGKGTRMGGDRPKVLAEAAGKPLIYWVLDALSAANVCDQVAVVGFQKEAVIRVLPTGVRWVEQSPQLGTGHALMCARSVLEEKERGTPILVTCGDMPLLRAETLRRVVEQRETEQAACALLTVRIPEESRFGRVLRNADGDVERIVEYKDASPEERAVTEGNTGVMCFRPDALWSALASLKNDNAQGEYYLTDVIGILVGGGKRVVAPVCEEAREALGVNTPADLAEVESVLRERK